MKRLLAYTIFTGCIIFFPGCSGVKKMEEEAASKASVILPTPMEHSIASGIYIVPEENSICYNEGAENAVNALKDLLLKVGRKANTAAGTECGNWKLIQKDSLLAEIGEEGYIMEITKKGVTISAATTSGFYYGIQSLRQLLPEQVEKLGGTSGKMALQLQYIKDSPKYSWRGSMIDISRSFFGVDYIKKHLDRMALYKMNRLHLHLTDDQGWRIEIKSRPRLTEIGSKGSVKDGNSGFLSREDYEELQDYAAQRNIVIIPEVDLPGHIYAALVAYPELNCEENSNIDPKHATPPELYTGYEVGWSKLCLEKQESYDFVADVIGELSEITTGPWIHIGGDEIDDPRYEEFVIKADSIVRSHGKIAIGWEEVTKAPVHTSLISQRWNGKTRAVTDVQVIESICTSFYLDHANISGQEQTNNWCNSTGVSLENIYNFSSENKNVIGVEAPVWTELVTSEEILDDRFWPRTIAVAEVAWSQRGKDFPAFLNRLRLHEKRLNELEVKYFKSPELKWN